MSRAGAISSLMTARLNIEAAALALKDVDDSAAEAQRDAIAGLLGRIVDLSASLKWSIANRTPESDGAA